MFQTSEIARLAIALIVLPFFLWYWRRLRLDSRAWLNVITATAIYLSYILTIVEEYVLPGLLNAIQHTLFAVAGVSAFLAALYVALELRREADANR